MKLLFTFLFSIFFSTNLIAKSDDNSLTTGWSIWYPYKYLESKLGVSKKTGLDVALARSILKEAGYDLHYKDLKWIDLLDSLKEGTIDFAQGVTKSKEREKYNYFSKPYRFEENSLFILRGNEKKFDVSNIDNFLKGLVKNKLRIAVIIGDLYADSKLNEWIKNPKNKNFILLLNSYNEMSSALLDEKIDGFISDRLQGTSIIWNQNLGYKITEINLHISTPIHLMFSKKATTPELVEKINNSIDKLKETNQYKEIILSYLYPILFLQTVSTFWFKIIEIIGIVAFAISGLLIAYRHNATLFGAFLFAMLPSLGGGIIRDLIFQREPIGLLISPIYLSIVLITVTFGFFTIRFLHNHPKLEKSTFNSARTGAIILTITDAMGLASFTVTGVIVSVFAKASPLWLWGAFFAFLTAAGGSILRDLLSNERKILALKGALYAEIAIVWGFLFSLFLTYQANSVRIDFIEYTVYFTILGVFITRLICYFFKVPNIYFKKAKS